MGDAYVGTMEDLNSDFLYRWTVSQLEVQTWHFLIWLVVDLPLSKICSSVGVIIPNIWKKNCSEPPSNNDSQVKNCEWL